MKKSLKGEFKAIARAANWPEDMPEQEGELQIAFYSGAMSALTLFFSKKASSKALRDELDEFFLRKKP